jgi:ABC-type lipoprotein release transport system permease subunit
MPAFDGVAFAGAFFTVLLACFVAALLPARRAAAVDPSVTLQQD